MLCGPGLGYAGWCWLRREQARGLPPEQQYRQALAAWEQRAAGHEDAELARLAGQPEWGSVLLTGHRTDIFGGTLAGWQALLTVHGASILAQRPLLTVDLTGQHAAGMLSAAARDAGISSATYRLPQQLGSCGLLTELTPAQLADAIAEALHAGAPDGARADRSVDVWILQQLAGALGGNASPQRLAAAVRAALGHIAPNGPLSPGELELIAGGLFPDAYRQQITANLVRLDAVLGELAAQAGGGWPQKPARYTCLSVDTVTRSAVGEVLTALIMQWLTVQVSAAPGAVPAVIIAGADEIAGPHAERLSGACEQRGVPVTLMFRHLRDDAARLLGGGTAAFMRLANHAEAEQAAAYIGRRHTYVISSYTATRGGNQTSTHGSSDGYGTGDSRSDSRTRGWQDSGLFAAGSTSGGRSRTDRHQHLKELVHFLIPGRRHQLERDGNQAAGLRVRRRADRPAEPARVRPPARRPIRPQPATARGRMRPRDRQLPRRQLSAAAAAWQHPVRQCTAVQRHAARLHQPPRPGHHRRRPVPAGPSRGRRPGTAPGLARPAAGTAVVAEEPAARSALTQAAAPASARDISPLSSATVHARTHSIGTSGPGGRDPAGRAAAHSPPAAGTHTAHRG